METTRRGDRIRLIHMPNDPDPIPAGSTGIIVSVTTGPLGQLCVRWDNGRSLSLVPGVDTYQVIERGPTPDEPADPSPVVVPAEVYTGITAAHKTGLFNMLDRPAITRLTRQLGFHTTADWLNDRSNHTAYARGIFHGFATEE